MVRYIPSVLYNINSSHVTVHACYDNRGTSTFLPKIFSENDGGSLGCITNPETSEMCHFFLFVCLPIRIFVCLRTRSRPWRFCSSGCTFSFHHNRFLTQKSSEKCHSFLPIRFFCIPTYIGHGDFVHRVALSVFMTVVS